MRSEIPNPCGRPLTSDPKPTLYSLLITILHSNQISSLQWPAHSLCFLSLSLLCCMFHLVCNECSSSFSACWPCPFLKAHAQRKWKCHWLCLPKPFRIWLNPPPTANPQFQASILSLLEFCRNLLSVSPSTLLPATAYPPHSSQNDLLKCTLEEGHSSPRPCNDSVSRRL